MKNLTVVVRIYAGSPVSNLRRFFINFLSTVRSILRLIRFFRRLCVTLADSFVFFPFVMSSVLCLFGISNVIHQTCWIATIWRSRKCVFPGWEGEGGKGSVDYIGRDVQLPTPLQYGFSRVSFYAIFTIHSTITVFSFTRSVCASFIRYPKCLATTCLAFVIRVTLWCDYFNNLSTLVRFATECQ